MSAILQSYAKKTFANQAKAYEPEDPYYETVTDEHGRTKRHKRDVPPGLSKRDAKALRKIRRRAHYLDKGINLCGFRVGWTFFIGIIPGLGDITDAILNYTLVVKPARKLDIPDSLVSHMLFNNAVSAGVGLVPVVGDVALAVWKANWRNAALLEEFLVKRGAQNLADSLSNDPAHGHQAAHAALSPSGYATGNPQMASDVLATGGHPTYMHEQTPLNQPAQPAPAKKKGWFGRSGAAA